MLSWSFQKFFIYKNMNKITQKLKKIKKKVNWRVEDLVGYKEVIGWLLGAGIAVAWIAWALLTPGNMVGLVVALAITIMFGTASGGLIALSQNKVDWKEVVGWVLGAAIAVAWISWALLEPGNMVGLVVALAVTILLGTASGGLIALSKKQTKGS